MLDITVLDVLYYLIIGLNFIVSIAIKRLWKHFYFIYFSVTIGCEILIAMMPYRQDINNFLDIFCIIFFSFYFHFFIKNKKWLVSISIIAVILSQYFLLTSKTLYSINTGIVYCCFLILISLTWFYEKISYQNDDMPILQSQLFWISSSLLLWAVFYLFRMTPMYYIETRDENFLYFLKYTFQIATNGSYLLFLKGLLTEKI